MKTPRPFLRAYTSATELRRRAQIYLRGRPRLKAALQNVLAYAIAIGIIVYIARGVSLSNVWRGLLSSNLPKFIGIGVAGFLLWFVGETLLFSQLFTYFAGRTTYRESVPVLATMYFLQVVNSLLAEASLVVFLHNCKKTHWGTGVMVLAFQGFINFFAIDGLAVAIGVFAAKSLMRPYLPYTVGLLAGGIGAALWVRWRRRPSWVEGLILNRPSLAIFRAARFHHYAVLCALRLAIVLPYAFIFFMQSRAFHLHIPLAQVVALTPLLVATTSFPISPHGLGFVQTVTVSSFSAYAGRAKILAFSLSVSTVYMICCALCGLTSARQFARRVILTEGRSEAV